MQSTNRPWLGFVSLCALLVLVLLPRLWELLPLYVDAAVRARVERALEVTATSRGWLLSDLAVFHIDDTYVLFQHRFHQRGNHETECVRVAFADFSTSSCSAS